MQKINSVLFFALLSLMPLACLAQLHEGASFALKYLVRQPLVKGNKTPLIILLHGTAADENDLFSLAGQLPKDAIIVSARAPIELSKQSFTWYHLDIKTGEPVIDNQEADSSRKMIIAFIDQLAKQYHADPTQVYLMGFSQGSIMSYSVALTAPTKVRGIIALSGRVLNEVKPMAASKSKLQRVAVFIGHGTKDKVLPIHYSRDAATYLSSLGIKPSYHEYPIVHTISAEELKDVNDWLRTQGKFGK